MPPKAKAAGKRSAPAKRKLAEEFPPGEVLTDTGKKAWKLGTPIGQGGFGLLYLADENSAKSVSADARYVIKVEPSENGPLFSELKFYMRAAKPELIQSWMRSHKLKNLGVPRYWGSGLHDRGGKRYRFMVIDRLGTDLQKKFEECGKRFPRKLVLQLGLCLLDILEYIHDHEYVHADIKASNLMLSDTDPNQVYLVDYGLAYRYSPDGVLKEYKEDPKRCHDGTIEFTSIDAHKGASACRRSDLEILCYCMVQWLCGRLPWEDKLQDPIYVRDSKLRCQENISQFMNKCFSAQDKPDEIQKFMEEIKSLGYQDKPPYEKLRSILLSGLKSIQSKDDGKLEFAPANGAVSFPAKKAAKRKIADEESETDGSSTKKKKVTKKKEVNRVKSPKKNPRPRKAPNSGKQGDSKSSLVEMGTQTTPGLAQRSRGRPKKTIT
ncbi:serine/threonine-protein kinase VRK1 isoform X1 [Hippoglossus stenolepis]|uniref:serine/threonine-protein kinase VRK1 isoform X1 n=1 Tax=Hippoglossus stenolepis TaxID=195615 RepID=UPI001FAEA736|nr:serine/threonine-protein kinase VRK1 isoform X1 [Hippoglossus stenolepis]